MKRLIACVVCILALSLFVTMPVMAQSSYCDPKKINECCSKINQLIANLDTLKAKLQKMDADLKQGKKVEEAKIDKALKKIGEIDATVTSEPEIWTDY